MISCEKEGSGNHSFGRTKYGVDGKTPLPETVDLGIKVNGKTIKWASCNLGASSPEEYGDYYAWGELEPKLSYTEENYTFKDNPSNLTDAGRDVARVKLGGKWRMPTIEELFAISEQCIWTDDFVNGVKVKKATGPNKKCIYFPYAGAWDGSSLGYAGSIGEYWSSSLNTGSPRNAYLLNFGSGDVYASNDYRRYHGLSVRPVSE